MIKAQLIVGDEADPVQVQMSVREAADLAFIAFDFAKAVVQDSDEAKRMAEFATLLSVKLQDCVAARAKLPGVPIVPNLVPEALTSQPIITDTADAA